MTTNEELLAQARKAQLGNYRPAPFVMTRGEGCWLEDAEGRRFLDLTGGIAVLSLGHCHPALTAAIAEQAKRLMHVSNLFYNDRAIELATELTSRTAFSKVYFANSGTEANEALLKLARRYHHERGDTGRVELVSTHGSFHGRSMGALSVTGQPKYHVGMEPLLGGVHFVAYGDLDAMKAAVTDRTAAILVEPVQAEGGVRVPSDAYLAGLRALADDRGALLLFDEVQTGYGRTGAFLRGPGVGVVPDACSVAKGIAGGFPLGAMLVTSRVEDGLPYGSHASTFGGNPLACAAGLAVLRTLDEERLIERCAEVGSYLGDRLESLVRSHGSAVEARGVGLLRGVQLADDVDPAATLASLRDRGVLLTLAGGNVLRFVPPLVVTREELDQGLEAVTEVLSAPPRKAAA